MNFIAFDAAYALYPKATFQHGANLAMGHSRERDTRCIAKYTERGWPAIALESLHNHPTSDCFALGQVRRVADRRTWTVPLDTSGLSLRSRLSPRSQRFQWDPVLYNTWTLSRSAEKQMVKARFHIVKSAVFRYTYLSTNVHVKKALLRYANAYRDLDWTMARTLREKQSANTWTW